MSKSNFLTLPSAAQMNKLLLFGILITGLVASHRASAQPEKPNVIFILLDDLGKEWISCYGSDNVETPNIDRLAANGMWFDNAYSMPQCTPSRVCFLTGQYPYRNGWINHWDTPRWGEAYFDWTKYPSIGKAMKQAGYATAAAGKWQINDFRVTPDAMVKHGFDHFCMWTGFEAGNKPSGNRYWDPYIHTKDGSKTYPGKFGPDIYNQFVLDFISDHADSPFFVYYPMALPHGPLVKTPLQEKGDKHVGMVLYIDHLLGKLVSHLEKNNLTDNTMIIFTADNGTTLGKMGSRNGKPVSGGKSLTTENGVNTPFIVSMSGTVPKGKVSDALIDFSDMYPTILDFAGGAVEEDFTYDGVSARKVFTGEASDTDREYILAMGSMSAAMTDQGAENVYYYRDRVIRGKDYKLFIDPYRRPVKLIDLKNDFYEETNLLGNPELREVVSKLAGVAATFPKKDADPVYTRREANEWDKRANKKSQQHKLAQPTSNPPEIVVPGSQHENNWLRNQKSKNKPVKAAPAKPTSKALPLPEVSGQFIRIELPGQKRALSLAEVKVLDKGINIALKRKATQSTEAHGGAPALAVDGNVDGIYHNGSVTHTDPKGANPWWKVDLGKDSKIEEVKIYNRKDGRPERLDGFTLKILNAQRKVVFSQENVAQSQVISFSKSGAKTLQVKTPANAAKIEPTKQPEHAWVIKNAADWALALKDQTNLEFADGLATPTAKDSTFRSKLKTFDKPRKAKSITIDQSPVWHNWEPIKNLGPTNLGDAPVMLNLGPDNYWMFGRYGGKGKKGFKAEDAKLEGFDISLKTTPFPNQYDAPGGLKPGKGGYHAWQSKDMVNWVHHGAVTEGFSSWVTTAEYADGKLYIYYDYPNDQDPHLYIDEDMTDGIPGKNMGMAFNDPSHGSDCSFIRDLEGNFHVIYEDWSPIDASKHSWDSPLAGHAVSKDGIGNFKILPAAIDERTKPTGKFAEYPHPHWHATDPKKYPGKTAPEDVPQHRIKKGQTRAFAKYEIHEPEQNAYGDWASICIGGQYYLFADFHPANDKIRVGWFTSSSLDKPFTFCGEIGRGHPDPDVMFAEGKFYLATQMSTDYISPGPWVETVEVRVGVDTNNDGTANQWTGWQEVKESYDYIPGFSKQVAKTPAKLDSSDLPEGFGFQFELRLTDTTENNSKPILEKVTIQYGKK